MGIHGLIKNSENKYLVVKRAQEDEIDPGCWDLPGGKIDEKENAEIGFIREVKEEAGLDLSEAVIVGAYTNTDNGFQLLAKADTQNDQVTLSFEHTEYKWVDQDELLEITPASIHLKSAQYLLKNNKNIVRHEELE